MHIIKCTVFSCALRTNLTAHCWGYDEHTYYRSIIENVPDKQFISLGSLRFGVCGLDQNSTSHCWYDDGIADSKNKGQFQVPQPNEGFTNDQCGDKILKILYIKTIAKCPSPEFPPPIKRADFLDRF